MVGVTRVLDWKVRNGIYAGAFVQMNIKAVAVLILGVLAISVMDAVIKFLSGDYALHQIVFTRAIISVSILLPFLMKHGLAAARTRRPLAHLVRGLLLVTANMCFYTGLASLPLAEASAIVFLAPIFITFFSWSFLGERFGPMRWVAVLIGLAGMLCVVQPFEGEMEVAYLWPFAAAFCYAGFNTATRYLSATESASLLAVMTQVSFILVSGLIGLTLGHGHFSGHSDAGLEFLLRAWRWPEQSDLLFFLGLGVVSSVIAFSLSYAYRNAEASFLAPFEYVVLPFVLLWGYLLFSEFPNALALLGIALIALGGFVVWLDSARTPPKPAAG